MVENLAVKNMVKNPKLSQAISDVSWGEITRQLAYKCRWYGRNYIEIDRWFPSSKRCSNCGYIALENAVKYSRVGLSRLWNTP
ncbi:MAG: zinc ribbon domain-containing protein [Microcystis sp. LE19-41.2A]|nr:zinc ribbon domain-containing protein [Microcystis sp. LE19-41.2A]MCZ8046541.1 zinc ribbon domain-containing protein [Microcystis sp. LE19-41.2A]